MESTPAWSTSLLGFEGEYNGGAAVGIDGIDAQLTCSITISTLLSCLDHSDSIPNVWKCWIVLLELCIVEAQITIDF